MQTDGNKYDGSFKKDPAKYTALKSEYSVHIIPWKAKKDTAGADMKDASGKIIPEEYFCSWLAIYPPFPAPVPFDDSIEGSKTPAPFRPNTTAVISIIVEIEEEPDLLRFDDNEYFTITPKEINVKGKGKGKHAFADNITIECLRDFSSDQTLVINSIKKNAAGAEEILPAGKLKVWANESSKQKNKKVVFVQVKISSSDITKDASSEKDRINNYLRQCLIELDDSSIVITLDVTDATNTFNSFKNGADIKLDNGIQDLDVYLINKLVSKFGHIYDSHFKAFYFDESANGVSGYSRPNADYVVVFGTANDQTASHEFLHSLNLPHTFDNAGKYTYEYIKTDNLLDYSHHQTGHKNDRCALWYWQWNIANNSI